MQGVHHLHHDLVFHRSFRRNHDRRILRAGLRGLDFVGELPQRGRVPAVGVAGLGAAVAIAGSALVTLDTTGWFLGGNVSSLGFAGVGAWLIALAR